MLRFLHLSDIHFADTLGDNPELNLERAVRMKLLVSIGSAHQELGPFDAILLVGDIGSAGSEADYDIAGEFVDSVLDLVGCPPQSVICVPGNHDVNWASHTPIHEAINYQLRHIDHKLLSDTLLNLVRDSEGGAALFRPLDAYNSFAIRYGCDISPIRPVWSPKSLTLGSRNVLVHGITSCWISDSTDGYLDDEKKVVVGSFQLASIGSDPGAISLTLCHHPPRWLRDAEDVAVWEKGAHVVLTGHEHEAGLYQSPGDLTLHVASGAVNPDRTEAGWIPAYNVIELDYEDTQEMLLHVSVHPRSWRDGTFGIDPDDPGPHEFTIPLPGFAPATRPEPVPEVDSLSPEPLDSADHSLTNTVMKVPRDMRRRVARRLGLLSDGTPPGLEGDREILRAAAESERLNELAATITEEFRSG
jgi:predicted phosphodiesterase